MNSHSNSSLLYSFIHYLFIQILLCLTLIHLLVVACLLFSLKKFVFFLFLFLFSFLFCFALKKNVRSLVGEYVKILRWLHALSGEEKKG